VLTIALSMYVRYETVCAPRGPLLQHITA